MRGKRSGLYLSAADIPVVLGMSERGDRSHDIAAWFGVNQGRIKEAKDGKFGSPDAASTDLPPAGPPGLKGRRLLAEVEDILSQLKGHEDPMAKSIAQKLRAAIKSYNASE